VDGFEDVPHEIDHDATPTCTDCHGFAEIEKEVEVSVHSGGEVEGFRCEYCHDPHAPPDPDVDLDVRQHVDRTNGICLGCHGEPDRYRAVAGPDAAPPDLWDSHAWLPRTARHKRIVLCICCHTPLDHEGIHEILGKERAQRRCESCHYGNSPVATKFEGNPNRATWITHAVPFGDAYVKGAMQHRVVDGVLLAVTALAVLAALLHGLLRGLTGLRRRKDAYAVHAEPIYDRSIRVWHGVNALLFLVLLVTGYRIHFGGREDPLISFETAFHTHNLVGAALVLWFVGYLVMLAATGNGKSYWKGPPAWIRGAIIQARYYLIGVFRGEDHPFHPTRERRFNPLQQATYLKVMLLFFPILVITGVLLLFPEFLPDELLGHKTGWLVATIHYLAGFVLTLFLVVHLYLATMGDRVSYLFRGMIDGLHRTHVRKPEPDED
jgi:thiosulfate reductase cytochrome b subunit